MTLITVRYGDAPSQFGEFSLPTGAGPHPIVIYLHGGFWHLPYDLTQSHALCAQLNQDGFATWNLEYRRVGEPGGGWPGTLQDVATGIDYTATLAQQYPLDLNRVYTMGHSAGGHLALWGAARHRIAPDHPLATRDPLPIAAAYSLAGVPDLRMCAQMNLGAGAVQHLLGGEPAAVPERYAGASPHELLPLGVPQILVHGARDTVVPSILSSNYGAAARAAGDDVAVHILEGVDHFDIVEAHHPAWATVRHLARTQAAGG